MLKKNIVNKKNGFFILFTVTICFLTYICFISNNYVVIGLKENKDILVKVPFLNYNIKYRPRNMFLHDVSILTFTNDAKNYSNIKNNKNIDYSKELIIFDFFPNLMLTKDGNMEDYIKFCLLNEKKYMFGNIKSAWMGSTGLFSDGQSNFIVLTVVIKVNNYYVQGLLRASFKGYKIDDVKKFELLLSNWVINFKKINNI
jgi:hypothetical protein